MKRIVTVILIAVLACSAADAQNVLNRLGQRAKNAAENAVGNKIENAIYNGINNAGKKDKNKNRQEREEQEYEDQAPAAVPGSWVCPECGAVNTGNFCEDCGAKKPGTEAPEAAAAATVETVKSDFVQGPVVLFEDNFEGEQLGEFPSKWEVDYGDIQIAKIGGRTVPKFDGEGRIYPLMEKDQENYLPDVFTLEWDMYIGDRNTEGEIYGFDIFLDSEKKNSSVRIWYRPGDAWRGVSWHCSKPGEGVTSGIADNEKSNFKIGGWNHFAFSFNKRAFKVYVNGVRVANVPSMYAPSNFKFQFENSHQYPYCCISNVRLGQGAVELYERQTTDLSAAEKAIQETGKFVTNNILFETGKATLKPESMADIQMVADFMKKNPSVRFEVQGHCDNQGSDKVNDPLSQQRAEAIVAELVKLGCDEFNLRAVGKGSHEPVADNSTEAGRAQNRRVEFIKK